MTRSFSLRSVNLQDDISVPERLSHYQPTSRSVSVIQAIIESGATMVMAAYGSGKSLAAGVGCLLVHNEDRDTVLDLAKRLSSVRETLGKAAAERASSQSRGRSVVLSGHVRDIPAALSAALDLEETKSLGALLGYMSALDDTDHLAIVWDEFGRHLEGIVNEGRARDLHIVQRLAEWAVRARKPSASFTLLLHQHLLAYATALNQTSRNEWRKIEGRFEQVRFIEDSAELYELAAKVIFHRRHEGLVPPSAESNRALSSQAISLGWFDGMSEPHRVEALLRNSFPLSAAALQVLPRLVARVGQNERSLLAFLGSTDLTRHVGMEELYVSFSDAMRSDVGIGGAHRRWVETETARSRAADQIERETLAAACLLQLGVDGERHRLTIEALKTAVTSRGVSVEEAKSAINALLDRKLLLHRKLNDDVSIWHGADLDLGGRIREERARRVESFDLIQFLGEHHPPPFVRPTRHNLSFGTSRFLEGEYVLANDLANGSNAITDPQPVNEWGRIFYVLADSAEELARARRKVESGWPKWGRALVALPAEPLSITEAALEVDALLALQHDESLRAEDPLVSDEIAELLAVARRQLAVMLHRLTTDRPAATEWWSGGKRLELNADKPVGVAASTLMDGAYPLTPRVVNDQLMRNRLTRQMETARIRVLTRVLERAGEPKLGYRDEELSSAEGSVYRTILESTGLHRAERDRGRFATPEELSDPGMRAVWEILLLFFVRPGTKRLNALVGQLLAPPLGVPAGVVPILVIAGLKAFGRAVSLIVDGSRVTDLLGFAASRMFVEASKTEIQVHADDAETFHYLGELAYLFSHKRPAAMDDLASFASDALATWRASLSDGVRRSRRHTDDGRKLLKLMAEASDVPKLMLQDLPSAFGSLMPGGRYVSTIKVLEKARNDVDRLIEGLSRDAVAVIADVLSLSAEPDPLVGVQAWVRCFNVPEVLARDDVSMLDKALLRTARDTTNGRYSAESFARAVSSILFQRGLDRWDDSTPNHTRRLLREFRMRIEDAALTGEPGDELVPVIKAKIAALQTTLNKVMERTKPLRVAAGGSR